MARTFSFLLLLLGMSGAALLGGGVPPAPAQGLPEISGSRIVVAGGAVTETLFALGLGDRIAALDTTSVFPPQANALPKVGYLRQLSAEGVLAMRPDMVLLGEGAGPAAAVEQIKSSSVPVHEIKIGWAPEDVSAMVREIGAATGTAPQADVLAGQIDENFASVAQSVPDADGPTALLVLGAGNGPLLGAGANTAAEAVIVLAGGQLALPRLEGYRPLSLESVLAADPDYIILPSHVMQALGGEEALSDVDVIAKTTAGQEGRIIVVDSLYMLGFGPRTPQAAADLATIFFPDADIPLAGRATSPSQLVRLVDAKLGTK